MPTAFRVTMALCISTLFVAMGAKAQSLPREVATRAEIYPISSLTLSDQQFLTGDAAAGKPVTVAGELRVALGSGKLPAVVLMHGPSGVGARTEAWVHGFNAMGISSFLIDGFT